MSATDIPMGESKSYEVEVDPNQRRTDMSGPMTGASDSGRKLLVELRSLVQKHANWTINIDEVSDLWFFADARGEIVVKVELKAPYPSRIDQFATRKLHEGLDKEQVTEFLKAISKLCTRWGGPGADAQTTQMRLVVPSDDVVRWETCCLALTPEKPKDEMPDRTDCIQHDKNAKFHFCKLGYVNCEDNRYCTRYEKGAQLKDGKYHLPEGMELGEPIVHKEFQLYEPPLHPPIGHYHKVDLDMTDPKHPVAVEDSVPVESDPMKVFVRFAPDEDGLDLAKLLHTRFESVELCCGMKPLLDVDHAGIPRLKCPECGHWACAGSIDGLFDSWNQTKTEVLKEPVPAEVGAS